MWGNKDWVGNLFSPRCRAGNFLAEYSTVFNTVEGNTTFYSLPSETTVDRWREQTPESFRFSFKLPQTVTHARGLYDAGAETAQFFDRLAPLGERLGPFMIQLPASFGPDRLPLLDAYLRSVPAEYRYAVELRHLAFYENEETTRAVNELLAVRECERVMMDTRSMRAGDLKHPDVMAAEHKKPDLPITPIVTAHDPLLRFVGHPEATVNEPGLRYWAQHAARWLGEGRSPFIFIHCPNNLFAPAMARTFHAMLDEELRAIGHDDADPSPGTMPAWPGDVHREPEQLELI